MTVLDHLAASLRNAAQFNAHDAVPPSVILWTDGQRLWEPVIDRVREAVPNLYVLAPAIRDDHTGPAPWIRYQLSAAGAMDPVPVVYLPGVSRQAFRSPAGFPEGARHLFALPFLGQFWSQTNGKDWTPTALLASADGGLGLDLAKDAATLKAVGLQLANVLDAPVATLQRKRLEAADFNALTVGDSVGMLLRWMADPEKVKESWLPDRQAAFEQVCRQEFQFSPSSEGRMGAAERLAAGGGPWDKVWDRFQESPRTYEAVRGALLLVQPGDLFGAVSPRLPQANQVAEDRLRADLLALATVPTPDVGPRLLQLAKDHRPRVSSVWAALDEAPLAKAVAQLGLMVEAMQPGLAGTEWQGLAEAYSNHGWKIDAAARRSFAAVRKQADVEAVSTALRAAYLPWLEQLAQRVAAWAPTYPVSSPARARRFIAEPGTVYLFVDGLRADVAMELCGQMEEGGFAPEIEAAWSPLPTVTATAKPGWQPLADTLSGDVLHEGFEPCQGATGQPLTSQIFRDRITGLGFRWCENAYPGEVQSAGWTETADLDARGHQEGAQLARRIPEILESIGERILELLQVGWHKVIVVTDHGWLWMPGGLPKTELPAHLTAAKWGRCAVPGPGARHSLPTTPWFWGPQHHVVLAPGISAFKLGLEYADGGLTVQEALTLSLTFTQTAAPTAEPVSITSTRWSGMRLSVTLEGGSSECTVDLRTKAAVAASSLLGNKGAGRPPGPDGRVSLVVADDDLAGTAASLVVLRHGEVVARRPVTIGDI